MSRCYEASFLANALGVTDETKLGLLTGIEYQKKHYLNVGGRNDLRAICEALVADIDSGVFDEVR